ncbi:MAG: HEAT repeat domain-containing protein, partial [Bacteroidota bacterium]
SRLQTRTDIAKVLPHILNAFKDHAFNARISAIKASQTLVEKGATIAKILPCILVTLRDDNDFPVRIAAVETLQTLVKQGAAVAQQVVPPILNALEDDDDDVRKAIRKALSTLVEKGAVVAEVSPHILDALQDGDADVRSTAIEALPSLVQKGTDVAEVLPYILDAFEDDAFNVRRAATGSLGRISTELIIDYYWGKRDKKVIPFLVPRLYEVVLTAGDIADSVQKELVLLSVEGKVVKQWKKSEEEIEHFRQELADYALRLK